MRVQLQNAESLILDVDASDHETLLMSLSCIQNDTSPIRVPDLKDKIY